MLVSVLVSPSLFLSTLLYISSFYPYDYIFYYLSFKRFGSRRARKTAQLCVTSHACLPLSLRPGAIKGH